MPSKRSRSKERERKQRYRENIKRSKVKENGKSDEQKKTALLDTSMILLHPYLNSTVVLDIGICICIRRSLYQDYGHSFQFFK